MENSLLVEKVAGASDGETACGVFNKMVDLADGGMGRIVACVQLINKNIEAETSIKDVYEAISVSFENGRESDGLLNLVSSAGARVVDFAKSLSVEVDLACLFFFNEACYVFRVGKKVKIFVYEGDAKVEIDFEKGSGLVREKQLYVVGTDKFFSTFDTSVFANETEVNLSEIIDGLATDINASEQQSEIAAAFVMVKSEHREGQKEQETIHVPEEKIIDGDDDSGVNATVEGRGEIEIDYLAPQVTKGESIISNVFGFVGRKIALFIREIKSLFRGDLGAVFRLRKRIILVVILIIAALSISIVLGVYKRDQKQKELEVANHLSVANLKFTEASGLISLNKSRAREVLIEADNEVKAALSVNSGNENAIKLKTDIETKLKETEVSSNVDFKTLFEAGAGLSCFSTEGKKMVGIGDGKAIIFGADGKKSGEIDVDGGDKCFLFDNKLFYSSGSNLKKVDLTSEKIEEVGKIDGGIGDIGVFIGNVYVVNVDGVFKFTPAVSGYSEAKSYLANTSRYDENSRMAIDGNVWVTHGNRVLKYLRGEEETFEIKGLSATGDFGQIYTSASLDNLYVVDRTNNALLVIDKDGIYKRAYQSSEFVRASDIMVSESDKKIYISIGSKILEADLSENP